MANLIEQRVLTQHSFSFESSNVDIEKIPVPIENAKFGILNFTAITTTETNKELDFIFIVDCSGSMSDRCSDGKTKMDHIIHTLKNMITFLHEHNSIRVNITINSFDNRLYNIVERVKISNENFNEIITKIDTMVPKGPTNIENALRQTASYIQELKTTNPSIVINHIFMTDGQATNGSNDVELLKTLVVDDVMNAFIGFGIHHDASLLSEISRVGDSSYNFIDKIDRSGFVYGEILHSIIYKALIDCTIQATNGLIYDFKTNSWVQSLQIGNIVSQANKTYNIITDKPDEFRSSIQGTSANSDHTIIEYSDRTVHDSDLSKHIFRQRTLQQMFEVNNYCNKKRTYNNCRDRYFVCSNPEQDETDQTNITLQRNIIRKNLVEFMSEMKQFMIDNELTEDKFMKNLCDDIYICFRTFDTNYGNMYCCARQTSQGSQRQYTVSDTIDIEKTDISDMYIVTNTGMPPPPISLRFQRENNHVFNFEQIDLDETDELNIQHVVSDIYDTPYLTDQATQVMDFVNTYSSENTQQL